jgi:glutathione S-transferase
MEECRLPDLTLHVLSLRYSSWSIRPWLALAAADAPFAVETIELEDLGVPTKASGEAFVGEASERLARRRGQGSVTGLFPVLYVDGQPIHESLAICEWVAESFPEAGLWPTDTTRRAQARSICCEMMSGFQNLRNNMPCHVFARIPNCPRDAATEVDIARVFEIWNGALDASGGPFLFGEFGVPDCMYFPVLTRFRTYDVELPDALEAYAERAESYPAVERWRRVAATAPATAIYDDMIRARGGDPGAAAPGSTSSSATN